MVWEAARQLALSHDVTVVTARAEDLPTEVTVLTVPGAPFTDLFAPARFFRETKRLLAQLPSDVVVGFGSECPNSDVMVMGSVHRAWVKYGSRVPYGFIAAPSWTRAFLPRHQFPLVLEYLALRRPATRKFIAVSQGVADDISRLYRLPEDRIVVIPNGFDPEQCSPDRRLALRASKRAELGLSPDNLVFLLIANEYRRKGLDVLLEAMAALQDVRICLLLVGRMAPDHYAKRLRALGLRDKVRYCGPTNDVAEYHAAADLLVLPTQYEAFGSVIIEALASGLPVITTALAGAAVTITPDVNGLLQHDPYDAGELTSLLKRAMEPGVLERWSRAASGSVSGYEWSSVMTRFEGVVVAAANERPT